MAATSKPYTQNDHHQTLERLERVNQRIISLDENGSELSAENTVLSPLGVQNNFCLQLFELERQKLMGSAPVSDALRAKFQAATQVPDRIDLGARPAPQYHTGKDEPSSKRPKNTR
ncbi:MAG: hypothetical protein CMF48_02205 [Legionellales bacterium]|nr:hypothetical protein [Legionellales bacterium]|tara:strand:+ start:969 stop:1316 length:348 start_codon:yes stop_codon:yes gene_type:complete